VRDDVHGDRLQLVFHIAHREDRELLFDVDIGRLVEEPRPGAAGIFREALDERLAPLHAGEHLLEVGEERRLGAAEVGIAGDVLQRVGLADGAVDDGVFLGREASEHDAEEPDERDDVGAQNIPRVLVFPDDGKVEGIDMVLGR